MGIRSVLKPYYRQYKHRDFISRTTKYGEKDDRKEIINLIHNVSENIRSPHTQKEILSFISVILDACDKDGVFVEAGCFKGSSTAKFSHAAALAKRKLIVFDSFEGLPDSDENHTKNIYGGPANFFEGAYSGSLEEVKGNVQTYGDLNSCEFVQGWFDDTMPGFQQPILAAYVDVDLVSSTKTCIKYLYPLIVSGGYLFSQDGHLPLIIELLGDEKFWNDEIGIQQPNVIGLGKEKLVYVVKP